MNDTHSAERLIPAWHLGQRLIYHINKNESFHFQDSESAPFHRKYTVELRLLDNHIVEAYYPQSLLSAIKFFADHQKYFPLIKDIRTNCLFYRIDENFRCVELKNLDSLLQNLAWIKSQLENLVEDKEELEHIESHFDYLQENPEKVSSYFLDDIEIIHSCYGSEILNGYYVDLKEPPSKLESYGNKILSLFNLQFGDIDLVKFFYTADELYIIELLNGHDTVSTKTRQNFKKIGEEFLTDNFHFEEYQDITLHYRQFQFDAADFLLNKFEYKMKINTPKMNKERFMEIVLAEILSN